MSSEPRIADDFAGIAAELRVLDWARSVQDTLWQSDQAMAYVVDQYQGHALIPVHQLPEPGRQVVFQLSDGREFVVSGAGRSPYVEGRNEV